MEVEVNLVQQEEQVILRQLVHHKEVMEDLQEDLTHHRVEEEVELQQQVEMERVLEIMELEEMVEQVHQIQFQDVQ